MSFLSTVVQTVLDQGRFCAVATTTPRGPHCTPLVFASSGARVWLTTSRRSVKARSWKADPEREVTNEELDGATRLLLVRLRVEEEARARAPWKEHRRGAQGRGREGSGRCLRPRRL